MISIANLRKEYVEFEALKGISLEIKTGDFFGLLGPNGAGKTTLISILSTLLNATSGDVEIFGIPLKTEKEKIKRIIGVVPQEIALYGELTALENLMFWGSLYDIKSSTLKEKSLEILELFGLKDRQNDKIKNYSGGMKRRINIASALLHNPKLLFLDEPTVGIDPQSRNLIFEVLEKLNREGLTVVYTTHYMEEVERLCNQIAIIDHGNILTAGSLSELKAGSKQKESIRISFDGLSTESFEMAKSKWKEAKRENESIIFSTTERDLPQLVSFCSTLKESISKIDIQKVNLESVFLELTGKTLRD